MAAVTLAGRRRIGRKRFGLAVTLPFLAASCATFSTVRSARVPVGPSLQVQASATTPPGEDASWLRSIDCERTCNRPLVGLDISGSAGFRPGAGPKAIGVSAGIEGLGPYVDAFLQLHEGPRAWGVGGRAGLRVGGWSVHQAYGRSDVPLGAGATLLLNPAFLVASGTSPNGAVSGSLRAFVLGIGVALASGGTTLTPAIAVVSGDVRRSPGYGAPDIRSRTTFLSASLGLSRHRQGPRPDARSSRASLP